MTNIHEVKCLTQPKSPDVHGTDQFLLRVQKPSRYLGGEINAVCKSLGDVKLRVALAFPDVYDVGMSHLGLKILYDIVNTRPDLYAERVYAAWPDLEALMRAEHRPLTTLETGTPLRDMDIVGFSLQYELGATNVLQMLDLGGIPPRAEDRTATDPFVVAGGPAAFNPLPLSPFFDAFALGDGEELILDLADAHIRWRERSGSRNDLLAAWKEIPGVFVPSLHNPGEIVTRRVLADLEHAPFPHRLLVPFCETVHDRIGLEIARGCTRGCRFCQAGMLYRPVRERQPATLLSLARKSLASTGWDEVALLSLSTGDYSRIEELIRTCAEEFAEKKVALSLPSLRTDTFSAEMAEQIRRVRKTGFTLAPEAGTDRLRRVINKGNTEEDLEHAVTAAFRQGWKSLKLYFMIGLPLETDEDLDGIVRLTGKAAKWARGGGITASVSTFVPKSHTPFQWAGQISMEEIGRRQDYMKRWLRQTRAKLKFHNPRLSFLEGVLARGDSRLSDVVQIAFRNGARFDGWDDQLRFDVWMDAFHEAGVNPEDYLKPRCLGDELPWDFIDTGVSRSYLAQEWERAQAEGATPDCRHGDCQGCGVCDFEEIQPRLALPEPASFRELHETDALHTSPMIRRFRLRYGKRGRMRFLGHHDVARAFERAFHRGELTLDYSKGFHPHPRLRFSLPLGLGIESCAEFLDFDLVECALGLKELWDRLQDSLPQGMEPMALEETSLNEPPISAKIQYVTYEFTLVNSHSPEEIVRKLQEFENCRTFEVTRIHKGKSKSRNLKDLVEEVSFSGSRLKLTLKVGPSGSAHPLDAFAALLGWEREAVKGLHIEKTSVGISSPGDQDRWCSHVQ